jgi:hypothetical protein
MLIKDFFTDTFIHRMDYDKVVQIDEITPIDKTSSKVKKKNESHFEENTISTLLIHINRILSIVCILSFIIIIVYALAKPNERLPDIISNTFSITLGYFGSAFMSFFERQNKYRK